MGLGLLNVENGAWSKVRINFSKINSNLLGPTSAPAFAGLILTGNLTTNEITLVNTITEFSTDGTLGDNSDSAVPTEKAVKTYVGASGGGIIGIVHDCGTSDISLDEDISFGGGYSL